MSSNVDKLLNETPGYAAGLMRHNRYLISMFSPSDQREDIPAFAVRIPGWDVGTVSETGTLSSIRYMPFRKNWNQGLFVTFYLEQDNRGSVYDFVNQWCNSVIKPDGQFGGDYYWEGAGNGEMKITLGDNPNLVWEFKECYPRVLYPIELKPVEDFAPFIFSVQFSYRYFDNRVDGEIIG